MKTTNVTIPFDDEKLRAARVYAAKKGVDIEQELTAALGKLYEKYVPASVREYIELDMPDTTTGKKPKGSIPVRQDSSQ